MPGALEGLTIVEMAGIGPAPFACMMLADHGARVIRVERRQGDGPRDAAPIGILTRSRERVHLDLKDAADVAALRALVRNADGLVEGFRPGVMERLGLGPDVLLVENARLVYGRMTGWGQEGPYSQASGHDINYIALSGNLHGYGRADSKPTPPINAVGDFGGGGMLMAFGMLAAILSAQRTGHGQVVDCAMTDGAALLHTMMWSFTARGEWQDRRGVNLIDTGAPCYDVYETADGRYVSVGALELKFWRTLIAVLGLEGDTDFASNRDAAAWPAQRAKLETLFRTRTRDQWCVILADRDVCFAPVLSMAEAPFESHNAVRKTFIAIDGVVQPAPAPRLSRTPPRLPDATRTNAR